MHRLVPTRGLVVRQKKSIGEALIGLEAKNKYAVCDTDGSELFFVSEAGGSFFARQLLRSMRPLTLEAVDGQQQPVLRLRRPWRWCFHEMQVMDASGNVIGTVKKKWSWVRRVYTVLDSQGTEVLTLLGPIFKPWTFNVLYQNTQIGTIRKKWSGLLKEAFTNADNFGIDWPADLHEQYKALLLGAVFLVDLVHFEARSN